MSIFDWDRKGGWIGMYETYIESLEVTLRIHSCMRSTRGFAALVRKNHIGLCAFSGNGFTFGREVSVSLDIEVELHGNKLIFKPALSSSKVNK